MLTAVMEWNKNRATETMNVTQANATNRQQNFAVKAMERARHRLLAGLLRESLCGAVQDWKRNTHEAGLQQAIVLTRKEAAVHRIRQVWSHWAHDDLVSLVSAWRSKQSQDARTQVVLTRKANEHEQAAIKRSSATRQFARWLGRRDANHMVKLVQGWNQSAVQDKADYEKRLAMWGSQNVLEQKARDDAQSAALKNMKAIMNRLVGDAIRDKIYIWQRAQRVENQQMLADRQYSLQSEAEFKGKEGGLTLLKNIFIRFNNQNIAGMLALWRQRKTAQHRRLETQMRDALAFQNADNSKNAAFRELVYILRRMTHHDIRKRLQKWRHIAVSETNRWSQFKAASEATVGIRKEIASKEVAQWILRLGRDLLKASRLAVTRQWMSNMIAAKEERRHVMRTTLAIVFGIRGLDNKESMLRQNFQAWQSNVSEETRQEEMDQLRRRKVSLICTLEKSWNLAS